MAQRGMLIIVEGCDRSGKSTQCDNLVKKLQESGNDTELVKFPGKNNYTKQTWRRRTHNSLR